jgi:PKD repeat protein
LKGGELLKKSIRKFAIYLTTALFLLSAILCFQPAALADPAPSPGDYIVVEMDNAKLVMVTPGGVRTEIYSFAAGTMPRNVAIDGAGDYIVTETDKLVKVTPGGVRTEIYSFAGGFPIGVAVDGAGDYIVTEYYANKLVKVTPGGVRTEIYSFAAGTGPIGVAIDGAGDYIVVEDATDKLVKVTPGGVRTEIYSFADDGNPNGVAIDGRGDYIVTQEGGDKLVKVTPGGVRTEIYSFAAGTYPYGVAIVPAPTGEHDVEAVSQTVSDTWVMAGDIVSIDVTVLNSGDFKETFDLTCYYDSVLLGIVLVVDLDPGDTRVVTFTWDTAGVLEGEYEITAMADPSDVIIEVDEANNLCTMPLTITVVTPEPAASFFWNPNPGQVREPVLFNALDSIDLDGSIVNYAWNFGDRSTGFGPTPVHTYKRAKKYTVTLTVTDNDGYTDTITQDISITRSTPEEDEKTYFYSPDGEWTIDELSYIIYNDDGTIHSSQFLLSGTMWKGTFPAEQWADFTCVETITNYYNKAGVLKYTKRNQVLLLTEGSSTLTIEANIKLDPNIPIEFQSGTWVVVGGTGDYAGARGRGEYHWNFQFYGTIG